MEEQKKSRALLKGRTWKEPEGREDLEEGRSREEEEQNGSDRCVAGDEE